MNNTGSISELLRQPGYVQLLLYRIAGMLSYQIVAVTVGVLLGGAAWWKHARQAGEPAAEIPEGAVADDAQVTVEDLPADDLPTVAPTASPYAATDAAMLADPDLPTARDADLYAWFAAGGPVPVDESQAQPSRPEPATAGLETAAADE